VNSWQITIYLKSFRSSTIKEVYEINPMDMARLKEDFLLSDKSIIPAGTKISAKKANELFKQTKHRGVFVCPLCNVEVFCAKQKSNLADMKPNEKKPYFKLKHGLEHDHCIFKKAPKTNENINKFKIKSETNYYSKLVEPYPNLAENMGENVPTQYSNEQLERKDTYTAGNLDPICDQWLTITQDCRKKNIVAKDILTSFKLSLPPRKKTNYYHGFRHVNGRLKSGASKIYHGEVRYSIHCHDGLVLLFHSPKRAENLDWKPVVILIKPDESFHFEKELFSKLKDERFLKEHARCFVYGELEEERSCFIIRLEYLNWLSFKRKKNATFEPIYYQKKHRFCNEVVESASEFLLKRYYEQLGITYSFNRSTEEGLAISVVADEPVRIDNEKLTDVDSVACTVLTDCSYEQNKYDDKPNVTAPFIISSDIHVEEINELDIEIPTCAAQPFHHQPTTQKRPNVFHRLKMKLFGAK
jgi:hypothetical protein